VRLEDVLTKRLRGGSFTGIAAVAKASPVYRDRAITFSGRVISASRQGAHTTFDYSKDVSDTQRATFWTLSVGGESGATVVAVIPHKDSYLICFTASQVWVLHGDPTTGALRNISREVGIIGASAWCVNHDMVYFLSSRGLYSMQADGGNLQAVSEDKIPSELSGVSDTACVLTYQHSDRGVYITLTAAVDWFYDTVRDSFWPYDTGTENSHVVLGPFQLGTPGAYGRVLNLQGTMATSSGTVTWRLVTGDTAEDAAANAKAAIIAHLAGGSYGSYVASSGTWAAGRNHVTYPRTRAIWCCLWLSAASSWAFEEVIMTAVLSGRWS
jgi:hypothetical protein